MEDRPGQDMARQPSYFLWRVWWTSAIYGYSISQYISILIILFLCIYYIYFSNGFSYLLVALLKLQRRCNTWPFSRTLHLCKWRTRLVFLSLGKFNASKFWIVPNRDDWLSDDQSRVSWEFPGDRLVDSSLDKVKHQLRMSELHCSEVFERFYLWSLSAFDGEPFEPLSSRLRGYAGRGAASGVGSTMSRWDSKETFRAIFVEAIRKKEMCTNCCIL